jgi:uncharacterized alkaline shock family protein YloU
MTEVKSERNGAVRIADEVLAVIAGAAAMEAEGVAGLAGSSKHKQRTKGVTVNVVEQSVALRITLTVKADKKIQEVSREVQKRVKSAIETMTGLNVTKVNVSVVA